MQEGPPTPVGGPFAWLAPKRGTTIVAKVLGGLLGLLVLSLLVFVSCGVPGGGSDEDDLEIGRLDDAARASCAELEPVAGDVRSGELSGPPLFRELQDVFNASRPSETEDFSEVVRRLLNAAIAGDDEARNAWLTQLQEACADA